MYCPRPAGRKLVNGIFHLKRTHLIVLCMIRKQPEVISQNRKLIRQVGNSTPYILARTKPLHRCCTRSISVKSLCNHFIHDEDRNKRILTPVLC